VDPEKLGELGQQLHDEAKRFYKEYKAYKNAFFS
jgi:hypothetical protein